MMPTDAIPKRKLPELVTKLVVVRLLFTFRKSFSTPCSKILISCFSALKPLITRTPLSVCVKRPVTSALIAPRSLKMGRIFPNAFKAISPKTATGIITNSVIFQLMLNKKNKQITEVSMPPTNCTRPVPTKFLTPSTSVITRDTSLPDCWLSKNRVGNRRMCF